VGWLGGVGGKANKLEKGELRVIASDAEGAMYLDIHMTVCSDLDLFFPDALRKKDRETGFCFFLKS